MDTATRVKGYLLDALDFVVALFRNAWYFLGSVLVGGLLFIVEHFSRGLCQGNAPAVLGSRQGPNPRRI